MPKKYRLTGEELRSLSRVNAAHAGKRLHGSFFTLLVAPMEPKRAPPSAARAKYAVVVSKKVATNAVDRNKIKRRARAALAKKVSEIQKSVALVFYAKRETKRAEFDELERDIRALLAKV